MAPQSTPRLEPVYRHRTPLEEGPCYTAQSRYCSPFSQLSAKDLWPLFGEERNITFGGLLDTVFDLKLIPGDKKHHCVHHSEQEAVEVR